MATQTETMTAPSSVLRAREKDSMKSTWRTDKSQWTHWHKMMDRLGLHPNYLDRDTPVHAKGDSVPYLPDWPLERWIVCHAALPMVIQQAYIYLTGKNFSPLFAILFYSIAFNAIAIHELHLLRHLGHIYGFLDGDKHKRDEVPDWSVGKVTRSLLSTAVMRPMFTIMLSYRRSQAPLDMNFWWLPIEIGLYGVILDFWFYWYHRAMHDVDSLWQYHRTHHLTKHPNPLLTLYADHEQEFFDIAGVPLATWATMKLMGMPMGFYEWWMCHQFIVFTELFGHSGLRIMASPPGTLSWLLWLTNTNLVIEDHDLHHRNGYRKSANYGKQTRLWDVLFGTARERIELTEAHTDYSQRIDLPLFSLPKIPPPKATMPINTDN